MPDHLVINYIWMDENSITVGATDNERWEWDRADGDSGVNAFTFVGAVLTDNGKGYTKSENVYFHCHPTWEPYRSMAMKAVPVLCNIAWEISNSKMSWDEAQWKYFGMKIIDEN
jgi:hypothetical protein